ncbi:MAG: carbohydrate binding domain-containing protein [Rhodospirillales bacterium]|nr:carbohydrate binding domain-containing protein [Acetobacter sp.]
MASLTPTVHAAGDTQVPVSADFANHNGNWVLNLMESTKGEADSETVEGKPTVHIKVPVAGAKRYYAQLLCKGISLQADRTYHVHFRVRSKPDADLSVIAGTFHGKFEELWRQDHVASKDAWTEYDYDIKPKSSDADAQIIFGGFAGVAGDYWLTDVSIGEGK